MEVSKVNFRSRCGRKSRYAEVKKFLVYRNRRKKIFETTASEIEQKFGVSNASARNYLYRFLAEEVKIDVEKLPKFYKN